jgi:phosphoribosylamine--glycine ligase
MIEQKGGNGNERIYQPYVLEFNARFGDPETQALLPLLNSDLLPILWACTEGKLHELEIEWSKQASCCVVAAAETYPESGSKDQKITLPKRALDSCHIFQAGTKAVSDGVVTSGGRVLAVTGIDTTVDTAGARAYQALSEISFNGISFRKDIGRGTTAPCLSR